jgi:predicted transcriptional regulator
VQALERFVAEHPDAVMFTEPEVEMQKWQNLRLEERTAIHEGLADIQACRVHSMEEVKNTANLLLRE